MAEEIISWKNVAGREDWTFDVPGGRASDWATVPISQNSLLEKYQKNVSH